MKLVTARASDYMRTATREDRRYLLYNPLVKARVTSEGEKVLTDLWDVIAAKGMEKETFFEAAARDIRWLPRLEGTVHVNTALMVKFMPNYLFAPDDSLPAIGVADEPVNDDFLFDQGPTRGLGKIKFRDYRLVLDGFTSIPNVAVFRGQVAVFRGQVDAFVALVAGAPPSKEQQDDVDFSLAMGQLFSLLVYAGGLLGLLRMCQRHPDCATEASVDQLAEAVLRLLGVPAPEAARLIALPLPPTDMW